MNIARFVAVALSALCAAGAMAEEAGKVAYRHAWTGLSFPMEVGGLVLEGVGKHPDPKMGVSLQYKGPDVLRATVALYTLGRAGLGSGHESEAVQTHFEEIKAVLPELEKKGHVSDLKIVADDTVVLKGEKTELTMWRIATEYRPVPGTNDVSDAKRISNVLVTAFRNQYLKVGFTYFAEKQEAGAARLDAFLKALGRDVLLRERAFPEDREYVCNAADLAEADPLDPQAQGASLWSLAFLEYARDIFVHIDAGEIVNSILRSKHPYDRMLFGHFVLASGAYVIKHEGEPDNPVERNLYALNRVFTLYDVLQERDSRGPLAYLDELRKLDEPALRKRIAQVIEAARPAAK